MAFKKNKEYYAVISERVDKPTIFSSWGHAHPRVTGCEALHASFPTLEGARKYMEENGVSEYEEMIEGTELNTTPSKKDEKYYYAVAYGTSQGITTIWRGDIGASQKVDGFEGACHKRFRTEAQAQAFIEDWNESYAQVVYREVKKGLDRGLQPRNMKPNVDGILISRDNECDLENVVEKFRTGLRVS